MELISINKEYTSKTTVKFTNKDDKLQHSTITKKVR